MDWARCQDCKTKQIMSVCSLKRVNTRSSVGIVGERKRRRVHDHVPAPCTVIDRERATCDILACREGCDILTHANGRTMGHRGG
jgi:hypothetical protein